MITHQTKWTIDQISRLIALLNNFAFLQGISVNSNIYDGFYNKTLLLWYLLLILILHINHFFFY